VPSRQDYQEALQAPEIAFSDPELKGASAVCDNRLGLPRAYSGQNATVFQMRAGTKTWAVKCFSRELPDQQQRYAAISAHLQRVKLPYSVGFESLPRGINVGGSWHPILKMEWVEGEPLKAYLERNLRDAAALRHLADRFLEMVRKLQAVGIAHGDLQHGNVFVCGQDLRLVDYDGMFVPALADLKATEIGHPNYQHPNRSATDFNNTLDNFSAWVIFLSLYALSVRPELWDDTGKLDECLLFRKEDFRAPHGSQVIQALAKSPDPTLQQLTLRFQVLLYSELAEASLPEVRRIQPPAPVGGGWIDDHRRARAFSPPGSSPSGRPPSNPDSSWVLEWIKKPARPATFRNSVMPERLTALGSVISGMALVVTQDAAFVDGYLAAYLLTLLVVNLAVLKKRYDAEPDVGRLKELSEQEALMGRQLRVRMHTVDAAEKEKAQRAKRGAEEVARLRNHERVLGTREIEEINQAYASRDKRLQELARIRAKLDLDEAKELSRVRQPIHARLQALDQKLAGLRAGEADELSKALKDMQAYHVLNYLRSHSIERAPVSGIGPKLKERLIAAGVRSAADVEYYRALRVERIGPRLASALVGWRKDVERSSASTMPKALVPAAEAAIKNRYAAQIQALLAQRSVESAALPLQEQSVRSVYASLRADIPR